jgi:putative transposase
MGIRRISIPYGWPNAAARIERLIGTLRCECLNRMLIWNEQHLRCVLTEFIRWRDHGRVHQGLNGIPDPDPALAELKPLGGRLVAIPVLNGLHHDYRLAAWLWSGGVQVAQSESSICPDTWIRNSEGAIGRCSIP